MGHLHIRLRAQSLTATSIPVLSNDFDILREPKDLNPYESLLMRLDFTNEGKNFLENADGAYDLLPRASHRSLSDEGSEWLVSDSDQDVDDDASYEEVSDDDSVSSANSISSNLHSITTNSSTSSVIATDLLEEVKVEGMPPFKRTRKGLEQEEDIRQPRSYGGFLRSRHVAVSGSGTPAPSDAPCESTSVQPICRTKTKTAAVSFITDDPSRDRITEARLLGQAAYDYIYRKRIWPAAALAAIPHDEL